MTILAWCVGVGVVPCLCGTYIRPLPVGVATGAVIGAITGYLFPIF